MKSGRNFRGIAVILITAATVMAAAAVFFFRHGAGTVREDADDLPVPISLNDTLDNSFSELPEFEKMDRKINSWIKFWDIKGVSLAVMRNDSLLFAKGYGWADKEQYVRMQPYHLLRIASVSKLITATAVMKLKEQGLMPLDTLVFGEKGILSDSLYLEASDRRYYDITVEHLLRHQGGFTLSRGDPMFCTSEIIRWEHLDSPPTTERLVKYILSRRLGYKPGTWQKYSNVGYMFLSLAIEKITGMPYEQYVRDSILAPAGCYDMWLGRNYYAQRHPGEAKYYMHKDAQPVEDFHLDGTMVQKCYGGSDFEKLLGAGAWVASASELARFVASIDGCDVIPDIISPESVAEMTEYMGSSVFPIGWADIRRNGEWYRSGTLSGTSVLVKYYPDGYCWILITNSSTWKGSMFSKDISRLFNQLSRTVEEWPERNLFELQEGSLNR